MENQLDPMQEAMQQMKAEFPIMALSQREMFAAMAMQGIIASGRYKDIDMGKYARDYEHNFTAREALKYADNLMYELTREKRIKEMIAEAE